MPASAPKRRKLSHDSSDEADDASSTSFASFSDTDPDDADENGFDETADTGMEDEIDDLQEGEEKDATDDAPKPTTNGHTKPSKAPRPQRTPTDTYTGGTFKSNMFKLQVDELLSQIRPKHGKTEEAAEAALHRIKTVIERIPETEEAQSVEDAERNLVKLSRVAVPFPIPRPAHGVQYKLEYKKPANVNVVGSYALKLHSRNDRVLSIDMDVQMPESIFQPKDYLDHRYYYKRAYYVAVIAAGLQRNLKHLAEDYKVQFEPSQDNPLCPVVVVRPSEKTASASRGWRVNILTSIPSRVFQIEKLPPTKSCLRPKSPTDKVLPTSFYNSSLVAEMQVSAYLRLIHNAVTSCDAYEDACLLGRIWLRQRGMSGLITKGGFGNFEWTTLMAILLTTGGPGGSSALSTGYSSYQLFKATLQYLAIKDLTKQRVILESDQDDIKRDDGGPLLFDGARQHNLLYKMTQWSYRTLRDEARTTLSMLGSGLADHFDETFILKADAVLQKYDVIATVPHQLLVSETVASHAALASYNKVYSVLSRGLSDRVSQVSILPPASSTWDVSAMRSSQQGLVTIAITLNPATASRTVDHGPAAENKKEAAAFRELWGDKAELRRFRDGSILESLVWSVKEGGPSIVHQIISHLIERHVSKSASEAIQFSGQGIGRLVRHPEDNTKFKPFMEALKKMEDDIRGLDDLPLTVRMITAASSQLRYSSVEIPCSDKGQGQMKTPADVVLQFEGSARWPDDLIAIQKTKVAFLLKLSELLHNADDTITGRVGLENVDVEILNQAYLDIIYQTGFAFRLRIHHDREQSLIEREVKSKTSGARERENAAIALAAYKRHFVKVPAHTQAVQKLCVRFGALSGSIRLTKKWFASHLLANHFADELIEMFVIHVFTHPGPWQAPTSAMTGFLRTLAFLSRWDWRSEPLIVDFGDLAAEDHQTITTRFEAWRKLDPSLGRVVMFAASSADRDGTTYTDENPSKVVAGRMSALARAANEEVVGNGLDADLPSLFVSSVGDYDFVIHLDPMTSGLKKKDARNSRYKNLVLQETNAGDAGMVGYDPIALFIAELKNLYGSSILLFWGGSGTGSGVIAGLWSPVTTKRAWKINLAYSSVPVREEDDDNGNAGHAEINKEAIMAEIDRLGGDLVTRIEVNR